MGGSGTIENHPYDSQSGGVAGIEFTADNLSIVFSTSTATINPALFRMPASGGTPSAIPLNNINLAVTQIELAKDGLMYMTQSDNKLAQLDEMGFLSTSTLGITNNSGLWINALGWVSTLPDQIDGQDYSQMHGVEPIVFNDASIGNISLPTAFASSGLPEFGLCGPIDFDLDFNGTPLSMQMDIETVSPITGAPFSCSNPPPSVVCYSNQFSNPMFPMDLRCLTGTNCDLFDTAVNSGNNTFLVTITLTNKCETVIRQGYFRVSDIPDNTNGVLGINGGNGAPLCNSSQNINSPCLGGTISTNINLASSTGAITFYRLRVEEVDCITGQVFPDILYDGDFIPTNNPGTIGLNSLEIDGATGHFAFMGPWLNRCLRIEAEVGNNCGSTTDFTFFRFDGNYFNDPDADPRFSNDDDSAQKLNGQFINDSEVTIYPNPVRGELNFNLPTFEQSEVNITVYNSSGQPIKSIDLSTESSQYSMNTRDLASGIYFYQLKSGDVIKSGKFSKIK